MKPARRDAIHTVYTLESSAGVYVGCTASNPEQVVARHMRQGRAGRSGFRVHRVMRRLGPDAFVANVVAQARGRDNGFLLAREVMDQVFLSGVRLLNTPAGPRWGSA